MAKVRVLENVPGFGWKDKIGYALGDFGCNLSYVLVSTYFMVYYVTCIGIDPVHYGMIMLASKIWDGINDPLVGSIVDKIRPKKDSDKFKPWVFWGSILLSVVSVFMFLPIFSASYPVKLIVCTLSYVLWDMCYTIVNVPYGSMASVISANQGDRADLSRYRSLGSLLGNVPAGVILPFILYNNATGDPIKERFFPTAIMIGIFSFICIYGTVKMCTERIVHEEDGTESKEDRPHFFRTFINCMKSRPMIGMIIASVALLMFMQSNNATNQYVFMLYYKQTNLLSITMLMSYTAQILMIILIKPLTKRFDKKTLASVPFLLTGAVSLVMMLTPMSSPYMWIACQFIIGLLQGSFVMLMWAMISDCIDYMEYKTGRREEGSVYSSVTLFRKIGSGFGSAIMGFWLTKTGYNQTMNVAQQTAGVGAGVKNMAAGYLLAGSIIIFVAMAFIYNLDNKTVNQVQKALGRATENA